MRKSFKTFVFVFSLFAIRYLLFVNEVDAVCPVCTVAVIGGLGLSRWLGIDDAITGIWIGGLIISLSLWFTDWLYKKYKKIEKYDKRIIIILSIFFWYAFTFVPLKYTSILGHPLNKILGMDKLLFGSLVGSLVFLLAVRLDKKVRKINGKQLFSYQRVVFPVISLVIISLVVYYYGGYLY
ncbi:hypothetical protein A3A76_00525 [Candidatus Woesebacteria bacterium RIFCSPLOWO2_01_FULL_39_23]|uniref:Uncharacterized protein n=1 Tax=Candidatus Woesebacteria bacterium RIFCSPHIGHO2_01_FULL_40_22 TaxID=1802499 RepID=A0A1F7YIJ6_9BACT|nr:MAG: hypothetical protein A2141_05860 [Candidatus Woesebacteria bacterium RBG_16_40_11]OGM27181.1 MAG: hypothetical protein A2628_04040 [Candidatus Woesebacteria bacterium RIFCSPHIGHO2_01_FULL_40_22]OGM36917.1 MAG: hypothetical protein A3E41_05090 [Candidatus Woesebacteria bacterium RIFCSPHIGHO2_12_FULL_38_9]OGM63347.1 MAG: hypothetical protein A3A76_00525 [Candidatus Woesebacteria bacterium RIFCSPLOWO2_01_FULL_39_23]